MQATGPALRSLQHLPFKPFQRVLLRHRLGRSPSRACLQRELSTFSSPKTSRQWDFRSRIARIFRQTRQNSNNASSAPSPNPTAHLGSPAPQTLSERMKKLSREYGWSAFGVYMALSALDFPFCFLAVRLAGPERVGHYEHMIVGAIKRTVLAPFGLGGEEDSKAAVSTEATEQKQGGWGVEEAEKANKAEATIWTQLALAYAIHKSFIFLRVPLTAAVTPKVVKTLRGWGWNIGKRAPKKAVAQS